VASLLPCRVANHISKSNHHPETQHYELIPQTTLAAAEASLRDEIGPFITLLLDRADKHIERQARRIETLKARAELNAGRLSAYDGAATTAQRAKEKQAKASRGKSLDGSAALRAKMVRQRKEALKYSVERLELEVLQKERELRCDPSYLECLS
jgi:DASH complex subunit SPC19